MLQLKNTTPFASNVALFPNEHGIDTLYTMVKASFRLENGWVLADEQIPPQAEDEYWGEPSASSLRLASDFHTGKLATDIIMLGNAVAPNGQMVSQLDVEVNVGNISKSVKVFGDRIWKNGAITTAKPFNSMPVVYERAFGGIHQLDDESILAEERNPVGRGFQGKRSASQMEGTLLPNIEDPDELIQYPSDKPKPVGFGCCSPDWLPRRSFAGTYDERWQKTRAPYLPKDFDSRFLNVAHPDLIYSGFIQGGEFFSIKSMHPDGEITGELPRVSMQCEISVAGNKHRLPFFMETLIFEPNLKQVSMVWKAIFECDKQALKVSEIGIKFNR
ncbi:DUF2169 domain-containing protein [Aliikangiella sp. G2MR2-5]|uniref:DUF2169 family type VI secretion system accessory protein n=1 Tax=Aliikangiella sp. G2MR2-5 TaxID=2788943 RepID=UPI0018A95732|nr:DUF2169 domain-containing protein [Aliikangiella sp. G2MR2-5]